MQYLLNNKIYDTEKSKKILTYIKQITYSRKLGSYNVVSYPKYRHTLYQSKKGQFFVHVGEYVGCPDISYTNKDCIELLSKQDVKDILNKLNDIENFKKLFPEAVEEG